MHNWQSTSEKRECLARIKDEVLIAEHEYDAHDLARRFKFKGDTTGDTFEFYDFWECNLKNYTFQYVWCCYAIAWGIRQYDAAKQSRPQPSSL